MQKPPKKFQSHASKYFSLLPTGQELRLFHRNCYHACFTSLVLYKEELTKITDAKLRSKLAAEEYRSGAECTKRVVGMCFSIIYKQNCDISRHAITMQVPFLRSPSPLHDTQKKALKESKKIVEKYIEDHGKQCKWL